MRRSQSAGLSAFFLEPLRTDLHGGFDERLSIQSAVDFHVPDDDAVPKRTDSYGRRGEQCRFAAPSRRRGARGELCVMLKKRRHDVPAALVFADDRHAGVAGKPVWRSDGRTEPCPKSRLRGLFARICALTRSPQVRFPVLVLAKDGAQQRDDPPPGMQLRKEP